MYVPKKNPTFICQYGLVFLQMNTLIGKEQVKVGVEGGGSQTDR